MESKKEKIVVEENTELHKLFGAILERNVGAQACYITDRDGVALLKVLSHPSAEKISVEPQLSQTFSVASEQASKLKLGKNKSIITFHNDKTIVQMNLLPIIVSIIGDSKMNVGTVLSFAQDVQKACEQLRAIIQEIEKPESIEQ